MLPELHDYDIFPKVLVVGRETEITVLPLGAHAAFRTDGGLTVHVCPLNEGTPRNYPDRPNVNIIPVSTDERGAIRFRWTFDSEQMYFIRVFEGEKRRVQLAVYCVEEDLRGRYPFIGDLHMHTCRSDGRQCPAVVAADYRRHGYDFTVISDHGRYYPSLEAMRVFEKTPCEMRVIPGEEIHLPGNDIHTVNFGGTYNINGLVASSAQQNEKGDDPAERSLDGNCPPCLSDEEFRAEVEALIPSLNIPDGIEKFTYAACVWIFDHVRKAGGLGIFAHPYWISDLYQVPETLVEYMMETQPFDAFEVLGGERYYEQNGFQTARYYDDRRKGRDYPIVGSTDSHSCNENPGAFIASTIIFSPENERTALVDSVKKYYSVAVDGISAEQRLVGDIRLVRYGWFLLKYFFPLHDELCFEEGRAMKEYAVGADPDSALAELNAVSGRMKKQREKYFDF